MAHVSGFRERYLDFCRFKHWYATEVVRWTTDAFAAMTKDEQFLKEAEKIGLEVGLIRGEDLNRDIESTLRDKRLMDLYRTIASVK